MSAIWQSIEGSDEMEEWSEVSVESSMDNIYEFKSRSEANWIGELGGLGGGGKAGRGGERTSRIC